MMIYIDLERVIKDKNVSKNKVCEVCHLQRTQLNNYCKSKVSRMDLDILARLCAFSALNLFYKPSKNKSFSMVFSLCPVQMGQAWGKLYFISYSAFPLSPTLPAANFVLCFPYNY